MLVLDASILIAALLPDERPPVALALYRLLLEEKEEGMVSPVFPYEVCNVIIQSLRRKRIGEKTASEYLDIIHALPVQVEATLSMAQLSVLAIKHALTVYDAAYLELARRFDLPLATLDVALAAAAKKEKVTLVI